MAKKQIRFYACKDEELPVISNFAWTSYVSDLSNFTGFSPVHSPESASAFKTKISGVAELVAPKSETVEMKKISNRMLVTIVALLNLMNRMEVYLDLAHDDIKLSKADFGIGATRRGINRKDPEKVIANLRAVIKNAEKYREFLKPVGMTDDFVIQLKTMLASIEADKQKQYEIYTNRKSIVQNNLGELNALAIELKKILKTGKMLFKDNDPAKVKEYTFSELKKRVHRESKKADEPKPEEPAGDQAPE